MSKVMKQFICFLILITAVGFGPLVYMSWTMSLTFQNLLDKPLGVLLFALGCLAPTLSTVLIYVLNKEKRGMQGLWEDITAEKKKSPWVLALYFLFLHYGAAFLTNLVSELGPAINLIKNLPSMMLLFGCQEIGWRLILAPAMEATRPLWKSCTAMGMIISLWFLPLVMIPGFVVHPNYFLVFAFYLVGLNLLQSTLRHEGGSIMTSIVFTGLFFPLNTVFVLVQTTNLLTLLLLDVVLAFVFHSRLFKENRKSDKQLNP